MLSNAVDPNYWAERIGTKTGVYDKAHGSRLAQWSRSLTGWRWWAWQLGTLCSTLYTHRERSQHDTYDNVTLVKGLTRHSFSCIILTNDNNRTTQTNTIHP